MILAHKRNLELAARFAAVVLVAFFGLAIAANSAQAFEGHEVGDYRSGTHYFMVDSAVPDNTVISLSDPESKSKITAVKSSNAKVASFKNFGYGLVIHLNKPGKATIKYKHAGKAYKHTYIVKKYVNPAKTFKIGAKNYVSKLKKVNFFELKRAKAQGKKAVVAPIAGWKVQKVTIYSEKDGTFKERTKGAKFKLTKYDTSFTVEWKHKKTGMIYHTYIGLTD